MHALRKFMDRFEQMMLAVSFAEEGCGDIAREIMRCGKRKADRRKIRPTVAEEQRPTLRM